MLGTHDPLASQLVDAYTSGILSTGRDYETPDFPATVGASWNLLDGLTAGRFSDSQVGARRAARCVLLGGTSPRVGAACERHHMLTAGRSAMVDLLVAGCVQVRPVRLYR